MKKILVLILIGLLAACESSALIQEEEVVLAAVSDDGNALNFASERLRECPGSVQALKTK